MLTYSKLAAWYPPLLTDDPLPTFAPGPYSDPRQQRLSAGPIVFISRAPGGPMTVEKAFDNPIFTLYVIGKQGDLDSAESLSKELDDINNAHDSGVMIGDVYVASINRAGSGPHEVVWDVAERWHYSCSYIYQAVSGA